MAAKIEGIVTIGLLKSILVGRKIGERNSSTGDWCLSKTDLKFEFPVSVINRLDFRERIVASYVSDMKEIADRKTTPF